MVIFLKKTVISFSFLHRRTSSSSSVFNCFIILILHFYTKQDQNNQLFPELIGVLEINVENFGTFDD